MAESLQARDRAVGCFHALVSVLQRELATFITQHGANASAEGDTALEKLLTTAAKQFICDHWEGHFENSLAHKVQYDLKLVVQVRGQDFYSTATSVASFVRGIDAIERVLEAMAASKAVMEQVDDLKRLLGMHNDGHGGIESVHVSDDEEEEDEDTDTGGEEASAQDDEVTAIALSKLCAPVEAMMKRRSQYPEVFLPAVEGELEMRRASVTELVDAGDAFQMWRDCRRAELCFSLALTRLQSPDVVRLDTDASPGDNKEVVIKCLVQRAQSRLRLHQFDQVLTDVDAALCLEDEHIDALRLRCNALIGLCDRDSAIEACEKVLSVSPSDGVYKSKLEHLQRCEELTHDVAFVLAVLPDLRKSASTRVDRATKELQLLAILGDELLFSDSTTESHEHGEVNSSITAYEDTLTRSMQLVEELAAIDDEEMVDTVEATAMYAKRAICRFAREDFDGAVDDVREVLSLVSSWMTGWRLLCVALMHTEEWHEALAACDQVLKQDPDSGEFASHRPFILSLIAAQEREVKSTVEQEGIVNRDDCTCIDEEDDLDAGESTTVGEPNKDTRTAMDTIRLVRDEEVSIPVPVSHADEKISAITIDALAAYNTKKYREAATSSTEVLKLLVAGEDEQKKVKMYGHRIHCRLEAQETDDDEGNEADLDENEDMLAAMALSTLCSPVEAVMKRRSRYPEVFVTVVDSEMNVRHATHVNIEKLVEAGDAFLLWRDYPRAVLCFSLALTRLQSADDEQHMKLVTKCLVQRAQARLRLHQFDLVLVDADAALRIDDQQTDTYRLRCNAYIGMCERDKAIETCKELLSLVPSDVWYQSKLVHLERCEELRHDVSLALAVPDDRRKSTNTRLDRATKEIRMLMVLDDALLSSLLVQLDTATMAAYEDTLTRSIHLAAELASTGDELTAAENTSLYASRAMCRFVRENFDGAADDARVVLPLVPSWMTGWRLLCLASLEMKDWHEALRACDRVLKDSPRSREFATHRKGISRRVDEKLAQEDHCLQPDGESGPPTGDRSRDDSIGVDLPSVPSHSNDDGAHGAVEDGSRVLARRAEVEDMIHQVTATSAIEAIPLVTTSTQMDAVSLHGEDRPSPEVRAKPADHTAVPNDVPSSAESVEMRTALDLIARNNVWNALSWIKKELDRSQTDPTYTTRRRAIVVALGAQCRFGLQQFHTVVRDATDALAIDCECVEAYRWLAAAQIKLKRYDEALTACGQGLSLDPRHEELLKLREELHVKAPPPNSSAVLTKLRWFEKQASGHVETKEPDKAVKIYRTMLAKVCASHRLSDEPSITSKLVSIYGDAVRCLLDLGQFESAFLYATAGLSTEQSWLDGHRLACKALVGLERWEEASAECSIVVRGLPIDTEFQPILAAIQEKMDRPNAENVDDGSQSGVCDQVLGLSNDGQLYLFAQRYKDAERVLTRAIDLLNTLDTSSLTVTERGTLYTRRSCARYGQDKFVLAVEDARCALRLDPASAESLRLVARSLVGLERWSEAFVVSDEVLRLVPQDSIIKRFRKTIKKELSKKSEWMVRTASESNPPWRRSTTATQRLAAASEWTIVEVMASLGPSSSHRPPLPLESVEMRTALDLIAQRDLANALPWIQKELDRSQKDPTSTASHRARVIALGAQCRFGLEQFESVVEDSMEALGIDAGCVEAYCWLAAAQIKLKRYGEATTACATGLYLRPRHPQLLVLRIELHVKHPLPKPASVLAESTAQATKIRDVMAAKQWKHAAEMAKTTLVLLHGVDPLDGSTKVALKLVLFYELSALCHLELKRFDAALRDAEAGLSVLPSWLKGHQLSCSALMGLEEWSSALTECEHVLRDKPRDTTFKKYHATLRNKLNAAAAVPPQPAKPKALHPDEAASTGARLSEKSGLADKAYTAKRYREAASLCTEALTLVAASGDGQTAVKMHGQRSRCRLELGEFEGALEDADAGLRLQPEWLIWHRLKCKAFMGLERWPDAKQECNRVVGAVPFDGEFVRHRLVIDSALESVPVVVTAPTTVRAPALAHQPPLPSESEDMRQAQDMIAKNDTASALPWIMNELERSEKDDTCTSRRRAKLLALLAQCRYGQKQFIVAVTDAMEALRVDSDCVEAYLWLAAAQIELKRYEEALTACTQGLSLCPLDKPLLKLRDDLHTKRPLPTAATVLAAASTEAWKIMSLVAAQKWTQALESIKALLVKLHGAHPLSDQMMMIAVNLVHFYGLSAMCYLEIKQFDAALRDAGAGLSVQPSWLDGYRLSCRALMGLEWWAMAMQACEYVLRHAPQDATFRQYCTMLQSKLTATAAATPALTVHHPSIPPTPPPASDRQHILWMYGDSMRLEKPNEYADAEQLLSQAMMEGGSTDIGRDDGSTVPMIPRLDESADDGQVVKEARTVSPVSATPMAATTALEATSLHREETSSTIVRASYVDISRLTRNGQAAYSKKEYHEAASLFTEVLEHLSTGVAQAANAKIYGHRSRCRLELQEFALALEDADAGLLLKPGWLYGHRLKYKALMGLERWSDAKRECDIVVTAAPHDTAFATYRLTLERQLGEKATTPVPAQTVVPAPPPPPSSHQPPSLPDSVEMRTALDFIAKKNISNALPWIKKELGRSQADPNSTARHRARVFALGAQCRFGLKQFPSVVRDAKEALTVDHGCVEAYRWLTAAQIKLKQYTEATTACATGLSLKPRDQELLRLRSELHAVYQLPKAASVIDKSSAQAKTAVEWINTKEWARAVEMIQSTLVLLHGVDPFADQTTVASELMHLYGLSAMCYLELKQFDAALRDAGAGLSVQPSWLDGYRLSCRALMGLEWWAMAMQACEYVLRHAPQDATFRQYCTMLQSKLTATAAATPALTVHHPSIPPTPPPATPSTSQATSSAAKTTDRQQIWRIHDEGVRLEKVNEYAAASQAFIDGGSTNVGSDDGSTVPVIPRLEESAEVDHVARTVSPVSATAMAATSALEVTSLHQEETSSTIAPTSSVDISRLTKNGLAAYTKKKYREAASLFTEVLEHLSTGVAQAANAKIYGHRCRCRLELQEFALALEDADAGLLLKPEWLCGHRLKCKALMGLKRWSDAKRECDIVVTAAPRDVEFVHNRLTLEKQLGEKATVPVHAQTAVPAPPPSSHQPPPLSDSVEMRTALEFIAKKNISNALPWIEKELDRSQADPKSTARHRARVIALGAQCRFGLKQFPSVVRDAKEALTVDHGCVEAYRWLTAAQIKLKQYTEATTACATGLSLKPRDQELLRLRSELHAENPLPKLASVIAKSNAQVKTVVELITTKEWARAVEMIQSTLVLLYAVDPSTDQTTVASKLVHLYGHSARCRMELKQLEAALRDAEAGLSVLPSWLEGHRLSCRALMGLERWAAALDECETVLCSAPRDAAFQNYLAKIQGTLATASATPTSLLTSPRQPITPPTRHPADGRDTGSSANVH